MAMIKGRERTISWIICIIGFFLTLIIAGPKIEDVNVDLVLPQDLKVSDPKFPISAPKARQDGNLLSRPFFFELASTDKMSGVLREKRLLARYNELAQRLPIDYVPQLSVDTSMGVATILIDGAPFTTVLPQDCPEYYSRLSDASKLLLEKEVAYGWAGKIWENLAVRAMKNRADYLEFYNALTLAFFFLCAMLHLTLSWISHRFLKSPMWSLRAMLWLVYASLVTSLHPSLDRVSLLLYRGALVPLSQVFAVVVGTGLLHQLTVLALARYFRALAQYESKDSTRAALRRQTLQQASTFISRVAWTFLGLCIYLYLRNVELGSFFAGAGLFGVMIGVVARDIIMDFLSGINILVEDQFGVGDWIELDSEANSGEVVSFSLRSTKIRRQDGSLATLPNSDIRRVRNHSNEWSRVDYRVAVTYHTDTDRALAIILDEIALLETNWQEKIIGPPEVLGIHELGPDGVVLRVYIRTIPLAQWETKRRLNRRLKIRFQQEGIEFAAPRRSLSLRPNPSSSVFKVEMTKP